MKTIFVENFKIQNFERFDASELQHVPCDTKPHKTLSPSSQWLTFPDLPNEMRNSKPTFLDENGKGDQNWKGENEKGRENGWRNTRLQTLWTQRLFQTS